MNIRNHFNFNHPYHTICREERNFAAIFYHVLLSKDNLKKFLDKIDCQHFVEESGFGIYFEYAFIRDIWEHSKATNEEKRAFILGSLQLENTEHLWTLNTLEFNKYFGVANPSENYIQSPGKWSITYYDKNIDDNPDFLKVCRFKWCFNAKPDIVIHTSNNGAICIEAKMESGEGVYPGSKPDQAVFKRRGLSSVGQREIQGMILQDLLGTNVIMKYLVKDAKKNDPEHLTWKDMFGCMDYSDSPEFIKSWINRLN